MRLAIPPTRWQVSLALAFILATALVQASGVETLPWLLCAVGVPANLFPVVYAFRPWRVTIEGRALMVKAWGNLILIDLYLGVLWAGDYPGREVVRAAGLAAFTYGLWWLFLVLLKGSPHLSHLHARRTARSAGAQHTPR